MTAPAARPRRRFRRRRVPVILQTTVVECGIACLALVLAHHGRFVPLRELRESTGLGRDGASAGALVREARRQHLWARGFRAEPAALADLNGPLIAHWGMNHFVVVERVTATGADIVDPASGRRHVDHDELDRNFTGIVLQFGREEAFSARRRRRVGLVSFARPYLPRSRRVWASILLASGALTLFGLLPALLVGYTVDQVLPHGQVGVLGMLVVGILVFAASQALATLGRAELLLWLRTRITWSMMRHFLSHLVSLPYKFFQLRHGGDLLQRVSSTAYVRDMVSSQLLAALVDIVLLSIYLVVIGVRSWLYVGVIVAIGAVQVVVISVTAAVAQRLAEREMHAMGEAQSALLETVTSVEAIKAAGAETTAVDRWSRRYTDELRASVARERLDNRMDLVLGFVQTLTPVLLTVLGAWVVLTGSLSLGTMLSLNAMAAAALAPVTALGQNIKALQTIRVHLDRLRDVLEETPESAGQGTRTLTLTGHITLDGVGFGYDTAGPAVLTDVDLDVRPGEKIAVVGRSGSGKSTLARLMIGLHAPSAGLVSFDGVPLQELELGSLRRQCGVVTQDTQMLSGSVLEAITMMRPTATMTEVVEAARIAAVHDEIVAMPMGYETVLGEGGAGLSGGQLQRLALARAVLARPAVLLLDEATSHLDAGTEAQVQRAVNRLRCTRIVIAHRLSTVRDADRILVVHEGRVVESGGHDELVAHGGHYAALVRPQLA